MRTTTTDVATEHLVGRRPDWMWACKTEGTMVHMETAIGMRV